MSTGLIEYEAGGSWTRFAHWPCGVGVSLVLFIVVVLSGRPTEEPPPRLIANVAEAVALPPPPQKVLEPPPEKSSTPLPVKIDFHSVPTKQSIKLLDIKIVPQIEKNLMSRIDFDLSSLKQSMENMKAVQIFSKGDVDDPPSPVYQPFPTVPSRLKKKGNQRVRVMFYVNEKGRVESPYIIETTDNELNELVLAALVKWKYRPAKIDNKVVRCWVRSAVYFDNTVKSAFSLE